MKLQKFAALQALMLGLAGSATGCIDEDPCDPGQTVKVGQCYPPAASGGSGAGATNAGGAPEAMGGAPEATAGAPTGASESTFGSPCEDTTDSSDCTGDAPVCADLSPLGQDIMCTQLHCAEGEENAGICPSGFMCFAVPGYPSICTKE